MSGDGASEACGGTRNGGRMRYRFYFEIGSMRINVWTPRLGVSQAEIEAHSHFGGWVAPEIVLWKWAVWGR